MINDLFAIDVHTHINHGAPHDGEVIENITDASLRHILGMARAAKIDKMICSTFSSVLASSEVLSENEYLLRLCEATPELYQWVVIEPRIPETFDQAEEILKTKKCVGIKLHPGAQDYTLADYGDAICDFASGFETTLLIHGGGDADFARLADKHQQKVNISRREDFCQRGVYPGDFLRSICPD